MNGIFLVFLSLLISVNQLTSEKDKPINLSQNELQKETIFYFTSGWRYSRTVNPNWNSPEFNDSSWTKVNTIKNDSFPSDWNGSGFFRFNFSIDSSLFNKSVFLRIWSAGKQEVYFDGKFITDNSD